MKTPRFLSLLAALAVIALLTESVALAAADITPSKKRAETVEFAQHIIQPREVGTLPPATALKDPFSPPGFKPVDPTAVSNPDGSGLPVAPVGPPKLAPARELIEAIAPLLTPDGRATIGGETILLFGKKRLKVGDTLPIIYKDKPYELTLTAIEETTFTLRLNGEEVTRPIKSAKPK